jgi:hypothetical protein|tara:strand:- start:4321 stop:4608 length:288 start_codon:yes stop_codon:yes gene_type:complete
MTVGIYMTPQIKVGDEVIFKREKLTKEWLIEYGTSSAYLTYTVSKQEGSKVFISSPFGFPFDVDIGDIERVPNDFEQTNAMTPFMDDINTLEGIN